MNYFSVTIRYSLATLTMLSLSTSFVVAQSLDTEYGGAGRFRQSVNGISVFAEMLKENGARVRFYNTLENATDNANVLVWVPDRLDAPSEDEFELFEERYWQNEWEWIVYVGRDYNAAITYWEKIINQLPEEQKENGRKQAMHEKLRWKYMRGRTNRLVDNELYKYRVRDRWQPASRLSGRLAAGVDDESTELVLTGQPTIRQDYLGFEVEELLSVDGEPFVFKLTPNSGSGMEIIVVINGSMLLNLPLVNYENRKLAQNLIDYIAPEDVAILTSGTYDVSEGNPNPEPPNYWEWMSIGPFRWIIPHLILFGLVYCFCYFPIFGRSRKLPPSNVSSFRKHIEAVGKLLQKTGNRQFAKDAIKTYHERTGHHRKQH